MDVPSFADLFQGLGQWGMQPPAGAPPSDQPPGLGAGAPSGFAGNRNAMIGTGLGMLSGGWAGGMQGYNQGSRNDIAVAENIQKARQHEDDLAERRAARAQAERLGQLTNEIKNYQFYKSQGGTLSFEDWSQEKADQTNKAYGNVQQYWVPDDNAPDGSGWRLENYQPTSKGDFRKAGGIPEGAQPAVTMRAVDTANGTMMVPQRLPPPAPRGAGPSGTEPPPPMQTPGGPGPTGTVTPPAAPGTPGAGPLTSGSVIPKNRLEAAEGTQLGKKIADAKASLPAMESNFQRLNERVSSLLTDTSLNNITGFVGGRIPEKMYTEGMARASSYLKEIQAMGWMAGIKQMVGLGALSDREGERVGNSMGRLSQTNVSTEDYKAALRDIRDTAKTGLENMRKIARGEMQPLNAGQTGADVKTKNPVYNPKTGAFE